MVNLAMCDIGHMTAKNINLVNNLQIRHKCFCFFNYIMHDT